jgi:peptidase E
MEAGSTLASHGFRRPIMVVGGGAFGPDARGGALEDHWLALALARAVDGRERPRVCLIATASGDADAVIEHFHDVFGGVADTSHLALFDRTVEDIEAYLLAQDAVYVAGGNTASLLAVWRAHGVDRALRAAHAAGVVLAGRSAGGLCWFESGTTDSFGPRLAPLTGGLGLIPGSHCPHYDGEAERRPTYQAMVASGELPTGIAVDDFAAAVFDGPDLAEVVAASEGPGAYRVERMTDGVVETPLPVRVLAGLPT